MKASLTWAAASGALLLASPLYAQEAGATEPPAITVLPPLPASAAESLAPPAPPPPPAPVTAADRPAPRFEESIELRLDGGATYRNLFGIPMTMATVEMGVGAHASQHFAAYVAFQLDVGQTATGLAARTYTLAPSVEWVADRFRLGTGVDLLWFDLIRASNGSALGQGGLGLHLGVSVDVLTLRRVTAFVGAWPA